MMRFAKDAQTGMSRASKVEVSDIKIAVAHSATAVLDELPILVPARITVMRRCVHSLMLATTDHSWPLWSTAHVRWR